MCTPFLFVQGQSTALYSSEREKMSENVRNNYVQSYTDWVLKVWTQHHFVPVPRKWLSGTKCGQPLKRLFMPLYLHWFITFLKLLRHLNLSMRRTKGCHGKFCNFIIRWKKKVTLTSRAKIRKQFVTHYIIWIIGRASSYVINFHHKSNHKVDSRVSDKIMSLANKLIIWNNRN